MVGPVWAVVNLGDEDTKFQEVFANYPPIRLRLGPGEGFCPPSGGLILECDATDKKEPDVLLFISEEPPPP